MKKRYSSSLYANYLSNCFVFQHRQFETLFLSDGFNACQSIINDLNDDDLCQLMESEDELHRCGQFRRIFPSENARQYLPYFDFPYYYNLLLIIWEERYHQRRGEAIARIRSEMVKKAATIDSFNKIKVCKFLNNSILRYIFFFFFFTDKY